MRYKPGQKDETRRKMIAAVGRGFRSEGYAGIGVAGLAEEAGLTSGAFYSHFGSKAKAFEAALAAGLDEVIDAVPSFQTEHGADWVRAFADYYLSKSHRADLACGCAMATLTPVVVRAETKIHALYQKKMTLIADLVAAGLAGGSQETRRARAWSMLSVLIGGLNVARAMKSVTAANEVAEAIKVAAIRAAGRARSASAD